MIRIRRLTLPTGLSALVRRAPEGDLEIFVSDALEPGDQRAAVRVALRSSRQAGWRAGLLPVPLVLVLAATRSGLRAAARALRVHGLASTAAASVAVASAAALIVALPHHHAPSSAGKLPHAGRVYAPEPGRTASLSPGASRSPRARSAQAGRLPLRQVSPAAIPSAAASPGRTPATAGPTASPVPTPSGMESSPPASTPAPTPSQPAAGGSTCLVILGLWVCL